MVVLVDVRTRQAVWRREEALAGVEGVGFMDFVPASATAAAGGVGVDVGEKEVNASVCIYLCVRLRMCDVQPTNTPSPQPNKPHTQHQNSINQQVRFGLAKVAALLCPQSRRLVGMLTARGGRVLWARDLDAGE